MKINKLGGFPDKRAIGQRIEQKQLVGGVVVSLKWTFSIRPKRVRVGDDASIGQAVRVAEHDKIDLHQREKREEEPGKALSG
ncbi:MAG: hypothetical protein LH606_01730 [Cytophagaceae bacterium]|nr:hypothetical protein [Cytophagaceae bacterium]